MMRISVLALFMTAGLFGVYAAHAQVAGGEALSVSISPEYPRPNQIITVTPESTLLDLAASTVTFTVNGRVVQRGSGSESANIAVGGSGQTTTISVTAVNNGQTYTKSISVRPADVALLLEPTTTTHPFYEGAALVGSEGGMRLVAVPDLRTSGGALIPAANLVYTWRNGNQVLQSASGIGKNVLVATAPVRYRDTTVSVTVSTQDQSVVARAQVLVNPIDPVMRIYASDPLLGPRYETALPGNTTLSENEATYRAVPYFFSSSPSLSWTVNGTPSQSGSDITVRPNGSGRGTARLGAEARAQATSQSASAGVNVRFGEESTGIFGF